MLRNPRYLILSTRLMAAMLLPLLQFVTSHEAMAAVKSWSTSYPTVGSVVIPAGDTVVIDTHLNLANLTVFGNVVCADKDLSIRSNWIMVKGSWQCGTAAKPYLHKLVITLAGSNPAEDIMGMGTKFFGAMEGGSISLHGIKRSNWVSLSTTANKGVNQINVKGPVDWKVGDKIVIASTDYHSDHAEEAAITAISGNLVTLSKRLVYQHWCQAQTFNAQVLNECGEVGLLTRNIVVQGDPGSATAGFGGHMMVMLDGTARLSGVELFRMGQKGLIARYPMHWHLVGEAPGQYLIDSSIHHAYNRFLSVHGTHRIQLLRNVGYDTIGHGYYLEDGIEQNNALIGNLGLSVRNSTDGKPTPSDRDASVFWLSHPKNIYRYNVAAGSQHTGFWLGFPEHPIGLSATNTIWPRRTPLLEFNGNVSHSNDGRGLFVDGAENASRNTITTWYEPHIVPSDKNSALVPPYFRNFVAYKNRNEGIWMRSFAGAHITGAKLADNWMGAYFANITERHGFIENSLIVGESSNKGNPASWETKGLDGRELPRFWSASDSIRGTEFYDGPMAIKNVLYANFVPNAQRQSGGLSSLAPNPFWISSRNYAEGVRFVNANRVYLHDISAQNSGDAFSTFLDRDGSVTGVVGAKVVPKNPVLVTPQCVFNASWNAYRCPHNYTNFQIRNLSGGSPSGVMVRRDDGAQMALTSVNPGDNNVHANLIVGRGHSLTFPNGITPKHFSYVVNEKAGFPVRVSTPYPYAGVRVTFWGSPVEKAASLAELNTGGYKYFHDGAVLHLRLVNKNGNWEEIEINGN